MKPEPVLLKLRTARQKVFASLTAGEYIELCKLNSPVVTEAFFQQRINELGLVDDPPASDNLPKPLAGRPSV